MEARQSFTGPSISKSFVAVILVIVAIGLGAMGAYVAKGFGGGATVTTTQAQSGSAQHQNVLRPAQSLRQDNDYPVLPAAPQRALPLRHS